MIGQHPDSATGTADKPVVVRSPSRMAVNGVYYTAESFEVADFVLHAEDHSTLIEDMQAIVDDQRYTNPRYEHNLDNHYARTLDPDRYAAWRAARDAAIAAWHDLQGAAQAIIDYNEETDGAIDEVADLATRALNGDVEAAQSLETFLSLGDLSDDLRNLIQAYVNAYYEYYNAYMEEFYAANGYFPCDEATKNWCESGRHRQCPWCWPWPCDCELWTGLEGGEDEMPHEWKPPPSDGEGSGAGGGAGGGGAAAGAGGAQGAAPAGVDAQPVQHEEAPSAVAASAPAPAQPDGAVGHTDYATQSVGTGGGGTGTTDGPPPMRDPTGTRGRFANGSAPLGPSGSQTSTAEMAPGTTIPTLPTITAEVTIAPAGSAPSSSYTVPAVPTETSTSSSTSEVVPCATCEEALAAAANLSTDRAIWCLAYAASRVLARQNRSLSSVVDVNSKDRKAVLDALRAFCRGAARPTGRTPGLLQGTGDDDEKKPDGSSATPGTTTPDKPTTAKTAAPPSESDCIEALRRARRHHDDDRAIQDILLPIAQRADVVPPTVTSLLKSDEPYINVRDLGDRHYKQRTINNELVLAVAAWCARQTRKRTHPNEPTVPPRKYAGEALPPEATWKTCFELIHMLRRRRNLEMLKAFVRSNKAIADHELEHLEKVYPDDMLEILVSVALRFCYARPDYPVDLVLQHEGDAYGRPRRYVLDEMRATWAWVRTLPACPPTEAQASDSHDWCSEGPNSAHPGARCYRSVGPAGPGQQCCYVGPMSRVGSKLLTVGPSAGTPDRVGYARSKRDIDGKCETDPAAAAEHFWEDEVIGFVTGLTDWRRYFLRRPPSGGLEEKIVQRVATDGSQGRR